MRRGKRNIVGMVGVANEEDLINVATQRRKTMSTISKNTPQEEAKQLCLGPVVPSKEAIPPNGAVNQAYIFT